MQSLSTVILKPKKIKSVTVSFFFSPSMCHEVMGPDAMISVFQKLLSFELADSGYKMVNKTNVVPDLMELKV